jgi:DNA-binding GntR family transcriptional regulator
MGEHLDFGIGGESLITFRWFGTNAPLTLSLPEQIAARIGDRIITGAIAPGARIVENAIAEEFQVSRGPVREALRILDHEGLVRIHARRGAVATNLSSEEVRDIFEIRAGLYRVAAQRIAEVGSSVAMQQLEEGIEELRKHAEDPEGGDRYAEVVFRLSLSTARAAGNPRLADMITSLSLQTYRYSRLGLRSQARRRESLKMWEAALDAYRSGNARAAAELAVQRIEKSRDEALRLLAADSGASKPSAA